MMNRFALLLCLSSCGCQGTERRPSPVAAAVEQDVGVPQAGSGVGSLPASAPGCAGVPEGSALRPTAPAMAVSFEADGATIRLTESGRFAFYDATSLEERRSLRFPAGSRFVDHGDAFLVGEDQRYWIGSVASGRFSVPIDAPTAGQVQMSPSGSLVAVRHLFDDKLELSIYERKTKRWRRIAAHAPATGPVNFCGLSERQAVWCPLHAQGVLFQDLLSGALTAPETPSGPSATAWNATIYRATERHSGPSSRDGGRARIQIAGPGLPRWIDDATDSPASMVVTCRASNRALVVRGTTRQMEMRTLPDWLSMRSWSGAAELVACSDDGTRVAWVSTCDGKSTLVSILSLP